MRVPTRPIIETRYDQMFPTLEPAEIERLRHFGETRTYGAGERMVATGEASPGMLVVLSGEVAVTQHNVFGPNQPIVTHGPGGFMGELAQLSGLPSLVDVHATKPTEALVIPSQKLREVMVAEAELGERIMRALILRRVGLLESGIAGPVIIGHADDGDVLRLAGFLSRNGHPHHTLDPDSDASARALLERFHVEPSHLPIVLCPNGQLLRSPSEVELARCIGLVRPIDPNTQIQTPRKRSSRVLSRRSQPLPAAVLTGRSQLTVHANDQLVSFPVRFTLVYVKRRGEWKMMAWQSTRLRAQ